MILLYFTRFLWLNRKKQFYAKELSMNCSIIDKIRNYIRLLTLFKLWSPCNRWLQLKDEVKVWFEATKEVMEELEVVEESVGKLWIDGGRIKSFSFSSVASFSLFRLQWSFCPRDGSLLTRLEIKLFRDSLSIVCSTSFPVFCKIKIRVVYSNKVIYTKNF